VNPRLICEDCPAKVRAACERPAGTFKLALVLDYPTPLEAKKGKLLAGDTGRLVRSVLAANGINAGDFYVTTALNCRPGQTKEKPLRAHMELCRQRLTSELRSVGVEKVLCLGPVGYSALTSSEKIVRTVKQRGRWKRAWGMNVLLTYAPIAVLIDPQLYRDLAADITKFAYGFHVRCLNSGQRSN
jgi:uracil-DNA glycosylase family 4